MGRAAAGGAVDIQGVVKSTVVRGQDEFPDGVVRITDCHDTIVYALAPLRYALVSCCTDCTIVLGAVGGMLRIEKCERLQLVATAVRIIVSTCHDCVLQLGVNHAPLLLGDNRFLQVRSSGLRLRRGGGYLKETVLSSFVRFETFATFGRQFCNPENAKSPPWITTVS